MKKGFTLVELLAVLVVLAIILAISIPAVSNIIRSSTMKSFESDAKMILNAIRLKEIEIDTLNPEEIDETNIDTILGLSNTNYDDLEIKIYNNEKYIAVRGQEKWAGFSACGTFRDIRVNEGACANDFEDPVITLLGDNPVTINAGDIYVDAGATASDDTDEDITNKIVVTGEVNVNQVGTYILSYDVTDNSGRNAVTVTRTVHVIDTNNPIITFGTDGNSTWAQTRSTTVTVSDAGGIDNSSLKYLWNTSITEPSEGSFSTTFTSGGTINSPAGVTGSYYLWVIAKDTQGNTTITRTEVFNLDNTLPVIVMNGTDPAYGYVGYSYIDVGATASDEHSGVGNVVPTIEVNINVIGTNYIYYNVIDNAGNAAAQVTRTVNIINTTQNYTSAGAHTLIAPRTGTYEFQVWGAKGSDDCYGTGLSFDAYGGNGGYATGRKVLNAGDTLSIYVGGQGFCSGANGPFNGGGPGLGYGGTGGGATDIRLNGIALNNRIIVAGGGGGGFMYVENPTTYPTGTAYHGGYGGGLTGGPGSVRSAGYSVTGGTQTAGGSYGGALGQGGRAGSSVYPGNGVMAGGGGGGYYGGGSNGDNTGASGGGGSSYIGGLTNASTIAGNASMPAPGGGNETGHAGNGYARIRYIGP